jgi:hypothetical protein
MSVPSPSSSPSSSSLMLDNVGVLVPDEPPVIMCGGQYFLQQQPTVQSKSDDGNIPSIPLAPYPATHQSPVENIISPYCPPFIPDYSLIPRHSPSSSDLMLDDVSVLIPEGSPICGWQGFHQRQATVQSESDDGYIPSAPLTPYPYPVPPPCDFICGMPMPMPPPCDPIPTMPSHHEEREVHFVRRWQKW